MARYKRFTFLLDKDERAQVRKLAECLRRSQSDAVRFVVLEKARELTEQSRAPIARDALQESGG